jgi:anti-sigma factor RsiW
MNTDHLTAETLHLLVDGRLDQQARRVAEVHMRECAQCVRRYRALTILDQSLRHQPLEQVRQGFVDSVIQRVPLRSSSPLSVRAAENLAYLFALLVVCGLTATVLYLTGVIGETHLELTQTYTARVLETVLRAVDEWRPAASRVAGWLLPDLSWGAGLRMTSFILLLAGAFAVIDRVVARRILREE